MLLQDGMDEAPRAITSSALTASSAAGSASSWTLTELAGAMMFAGAATTGAMLLGGQMEGLRGKTTCGGGAGGGGGGGGGDGPVYFVQRRGSFNGMQGIRGFLPASAAVDLCFAGARAKRQHWLVLFGFGFGT